MGLFVIFILAPLILGFIAFTGAPALIPYFWGMVVMEALIFFGAWWEEDEESESEEK